MCEMQKVYFSVPPDSRRRPSGPYIKDDERLKKWKVFYTAKVIEFLEDLVAEVLKRRSELARRWGYHPSTLSEILGGKMAVELEDLARLYWYVIKGNPRWERRFWKFMRSVIDHEE